MIMGEGEYNENSIDAVLSRIENTLKTHVEGTAVYRKKLDDSIEEHAKRISSLENDKAKACGLAAGAGIAGGGLGAFLHKLFN
jgi:hypothetical protein